MNRFLILTKRDIILAFRQGGAGMMSVTFFVIAVTLFPLGVGPESGLLARIAAGVIWVAALLASLLSLDRLFQADFEDGSLDLITLSPMFLEFVVIAKCAAQWLTTAVPLIVAAPILALLLNMDGEGLSIMILSMLIGTPALSLIGSVGAALTVSLRRGGVLLSLLVLPLYIPVLIFGVSAVEAALTGVPAEPHLMILGAISLGSLVLCPWASAAALRLSLE